MLIVVANAVLSFKIVRNALLLTEDDIVPNDLTAKQNVLSWGASVRLALFQHIDSKGFFPRGGGV